MVHDILSVDTSDERVQALLRRWADDRYGTRFGPSEQVQFNFREGYGGGCETCGFGADEDSLTVRVQRPDNYHIEEHDESYSTGLINDILRFAVS